MNVIFLSMNRCGVSWLGEILKDLYHQCKGKPLEIKYEVSRERASRECLKGWNTVYDIEPQILLNLGYDKILILQRGLEAMEEAHTVYHGYQEIYDTIDQMKRERPAFFERIRLQYQLLYERTPESERILKVSLEDLNNHTIHEFRKITDFLGIKMSFWRKLILLFTNKLQPILVPVKPERDWEVYSTPLPSEYELCNRLQYLKKIRGKKIQCQM
jgi:hypothetical protein